MHPISQQIYCAQFTSAYMEIACSISLQGYSCIAYLIKVLNPWAGLMLKFSFYHTTYSVVLSLEVAGLCLHGMSFTSVGIVNCSIK